MNSHYSKLSKTLHQKFKDIVGEDNYYSNYDIRWTYAFGSTIFEKDWIPELILMPSSNEEISKIMYLANENRIPITPRGSGTSLSAGSKSAFGGIVIDLSQMNKILSIDISNNLVEVEPGVICDDLNEQLKKYNYFFPPDPGSSSVCTIGGMVATNSGGIQAFKYGVTKDYVLFLEVVLANGDVINLGSRVLKTVSSYNLKDLMIGSEGTLGIITKIGLRIKPLPQKRKLGLYIFKNIEDISLSVIKLRKTGIIPNLLEFLDKLTTQAVFEYLSGEFKNYPIGYVLLAEIDGNNEEEIKESFTILNDTILERNPIFNKVASNDEEREKLITARKNALPALARVSPTACLEDCTIQITDFAKVVKKIESLPKDLKLSRIKVASFGHMEGNLHPTFLFNENDEIDVDEYHFALNYLYKMLILPVGGTITGEHGIGKIKTSFLSLEHNSNVLEIMYQIKKLLDPNGILNPGQGKADGKPVINNRVIRRLKNQSDKILELNCMGCGFCIVTCPSRIHFKSEAFSPRGRLSILNGLVYGELTLDPLINDIFHSCTLCELCMQKCPAGVKMGEIFEKAREIIHESNIR